MESKIKVTNGNQFENLVEELQKNTSLGRGFRRGTVPSNFKGQWDEISKILNALGPPRRTGDGWQKVWRDLKFKVKKKLVANKTECNATDGGIYKHIALSPLEEAVANIVQFDKQLNPEGAVQGVQEPSGCEGLQIDSAVENVINDIAESCSMLLPIDDESPSTSNTQYPIVETKSPRKRVSTPSKRSRSCTPAKLKINSRAGLLQKHSDGHAKLLTDICNTLTSIKHSVKDNAKYQKQLVLIENEKLSILKDRSKREKDLHESAIELNKIKILIKKKNSKSLRNKNY